MAECFLSTSRNTRFCHSSSFQPLVKRDKGGRLAQHNLQKAREEKRRTWKGHHGGRGGGIENTVGTRRCESKPTFDKYTVRERPFEYEQGKGVTKLFAYHHTLLEEIY